MINQHTKSWGVYASTANNTYGQKAIGEKLIDADITIVTLSKSKVETDVRFVNSTHFGLTKDSTIVSGNYISDGIETYIVEYRIGDTRLKQLYLKEV